MNRSEAEQALASLVQLSTEREAARAARDTAIAAAEKKHGPGILKLSESIGQLEKALEGWYRSGGNGGKHLDLLHGRIGLRAPASPGLVLLPRWTWPKVRAKVQKLWKGAYFHKPIPPALDKMKMKTALTAEQLEQGGLKLDDSKHFYYELLGPIAKRGAA
jgi:hypothetical protein